MIVEDLVYCADRYTEDVCQVPRFVVSVIVHVPDQLLILDRQPDRFINFLFFGVCRHCPLFFGLVSTRMFFFGSPAPFDTFSAPQVHGFDQSLHTQGLRWMMGV